MDYLRPKRANLPFDSKLIETDLVEYIRRLIKQGEASYTSIWQAFKRLEPSTIELSAAGPTDDLDVSGITAVFIDASSNDVVLGGTVGGVNGQTLHITIIDTAAGKNVTVEDKEATGNQDFYLHKGSDETLTNEVGGWVFVNHDGDHWHDVSHAKHV